MARQPAPSRSPNELPTSLEGVFELERPLADSLADTATAAAVSLVGLLDGDAGCDAAARDERITQLRGVVLRSWTEPLSARDVAAALAGGRRAPSAPVAEEAARRIHARLQQWFRTSIRAVRFDYVFADRAELSVPLGDGLAVQRPVLALWAVASSGRTSLLHVGPDPGDDLAAELDALQARGVQAPRYAACGRGSLAEPIGRHFGPLARPWPLVRRWAEEAQPLGAGARKRATAEFWAAVAARPAPGDTTVRTPQAVLERYAARGVRPERVLAALTAAGPTPLRRGADPTSERADDEDHPSNGAAPAGRAPRDAAAPSNGHVTVDEPAGPPPPGEPAPSGPGARRTPSKRPAAARPATGAARPATAAARPAVTARRDGADRWPHRATTEPSRPASGERDLTDLVRLLRRRWKVVALCTVAALTLALVVVGSRTDRYRTHTEVLVRDALLSGQDIQTVPSASTPADRDRTLANELALIRGPDVLGVVQERLGDDVALSADHVADTDLLRFEAEAASPTGAADAADAAAARYLDRVRNRLEAELRISRQLVEDLDLRTAQAALGSGAEAQATVSRLVAERQQVSGVVATLERRLASQDELGAGVLGDAEVPEGPAGTSLPTLVVVCALVGLLMGMGLATVVDVLDGRPRSAAALETMLGAPVLAAGRAPRGRRPPIELTGRQLRQGLSRLGVGDTVQVVQLTDTDGKLAPTWAGRLTDQFRRAGTSAALVRFEPGARADAPDGGADVHVVPVDIDVAGLRATVDALRGSFDVIVLEAPGLLREASAVAASDVVDGVVVVAAAGRTARADLEATAEQLHSVGAVVLAGLLVEAARA